MKDIEKAYINPSEYYDSPADVLKDPHLNQEQMRRVLESWHVDQIELSHATEENMGTVESNLLGEIADALRQLDEKA